MKKMNLTSLYKIKDRYAKGEIDRSVAIILSGDQNNVDILMDGLYLNPDECGAESVNKFNYAVGRVLEFAQEILPAELYTTFHTPQGEKRVAEAKEVAEKNKPKTKPSLRVVE